MKLGFKVAALCLLASSVAQAAVVTIDADNVAADSVMNAAFAAMGVTFSAFGSSTDGNVYSRTSNLATSGTRVFGNSAAFDTGWRSGSRSLRADFAGGTDFAAIDLISDDGSDIGSLEVFNAANELLASLNTGNMLGAGTFVTLSYASVMGNIAYIVATGFDGDNVLLDRLQFNDRQNGRLPEPGTLGLAALALLGAAGLRRRGV